MEQMMNSESSASLLQMQCYAVVLMPHNVSISVMNTIEVIEKQYDGWLISVNNIYCALSIKPIALYLENNLYPLKPNCDNGLRWKVNNKWVSYNQIKEAILLDKKQLKQSV